jgi:uroporphyrinogen decarboxylase
MTSIERVENIFKHKSVDHLPISEDFWDDTIKKWVDEGHIKEGESLIEHFDLDLDRAGLINWYVDPAFGFKLIHEDEDTKLLLDGNGAKLRQHKHHASTPEHVDFMIKDRSSWGKYAKSSLLETNKERIPFEEYRQKRQRAQKQQLHFSNDAFGPFEMMQRLCGHETLLLNMALDPDWIKDMVMTYTEFNINHWEILFTEEELPQSTWIAEDLGYKLKSFMSPAMFKEILQPGIKRMCDYLHSKGLKVILHSCGYIEPLLPSLIEAGIDCLEGMEVKAGMDIMELFKKYGEYLVFFGNIDIRALESNNYDEIDAELSKISNIIGKGGRCMLHSDHSISPRVEYKTFCYYLERGRQITAAGNLP